MFSIREYGLVYSSTKSKEKEYIRLVLCEVKRSRTLEVAGAERFNVIQNEGM